MTYPIYNFFLYVLSPIIWGYFLYRGFKDKRYWAGFSERLGLVHQSETDPILHLHCASVGESIAAIPLILQLKTDFPDQALWITTTSPTGRLEVIKIIENYALEKTYLSYLPIDWFGSVNRFISRVRPNASILMETEIWPNLTRQMKRHNIPVILANARLSDKSLNKYLKRAEFSKQLFANISLVAAQYPSDEANFAKLGVDASKLKVVGSTKFDIQISQATLAAQQHFSQAFIKGRPSWIAASIHPGEFESILECHRSLLKSCPGLLLIAVPRHPEAFDKLKHMCADFQLEFVSKSANNPPLKNTSVIVGDTMGQMMVMCGGADLAFVGGSLIARGGHNPLEPAACGLPVVMGPSSYNFSDVCQIMSSNGTLTKVENRQQLETFIRSTLNDKQLLEQHELSTKSLFEKNRGSAVKISQSITELLSQN